MRLKNKRTGEIVEVESLGHAKSLKEKFGHQVTLSWKIEENLDTCKTYNSLAELNEEWEDYEEPKEYWCITGRGNLHYLQDMTDENDKDHRQIGNYFNTREEAELAVRKLKAWKRLKDKGFRFEGWDNTDRSTIHNFSLFVAIEDLESINKDLDLLFGGEE